MLNVYKNFGQLTGLEKFNLIWNPAFMLFEAFLAVTLHTLFPVLFIALFGALWVLAIHNAQRGLVLREQIRQSEAEYRRSLDRIFGRKDDAA